MVAIEWLVALSFFASGCKTSNAVNNESSNLQDSAVNVDVESNNKVFLYLDAASVQKMFGSDAISMKDAGRVSEFAYLLAFDAAEQFRFTQVRKYVTKTTTEGDLEGKLVAIDSEVIPYVNSVVSRFWYITSSVNSSKKKLRSLKSILETVNSGKFYYGGEFNLATGRTADQGAFIYPDERNRYTKYVSKTRFSLDALKADNEIEARRKQAEFEKNRPLTAEEKRLREYLATPSASCSPRVPGSPSNPGIQ